MGKQWITPRLDARRVLRGHSVVCVDFEGTVPPNFAIKKE